MPYYIKVSSIVFLLIGCSNIYAQVDTLAELYNTLNKVQKNIDIIKDRVNEDSLSEEIVGEFYYLKKTNLYEIQADGSTNTFNDSIEISKIEITLRDGIIRSVRTFATNGMEFNNSRINVALTNIESKDEDRYTYKDKKKYIINIEDKQLYINPFDFLRYRPRQGRFFLPDDSKFVLNNNTLLSENLTKGVDLNSHVSLRVFTDLLGVIEDEPNGIVQSEFSSKIGLFKDPVINDFFVFPYIKPSIIYRRFDSDDNFLDLTGLSTGEQLESELFFELIQKSFLTLSLELNMYRHTGVRREAEFSFGFNYSYSKAIFENADKQNLNYSTFFSKIEFLLLEFDNFGIYTGGQLSAALLEERADISTNNLLLGTFNSEVFYYPIKNKKNYLYLRFQYLKALSAENNSGDDVKIKGFPALQLGYKANINFSKSK